MAMTEPLLSVRELEKHYPLKRGFFNRTVGSVRAVDGISFDIYPGETFGIVGESGCGKSTAASSIVGLEEPTDGEVIFNGGGREPADRTSDGTHPNDVTTFDSDDLKRFRRDVQMIFQDPASSFNPRQQVGRAVGELLEIHGMSDRGQRRAVVEDLLERVGLSAADYERYPHEFSGGQKQRIAIARALVLNPELVIADEPVSALDVSIQAEVLSLIEELQREFELSILLISHDMSVVRSICDRVAVMYLGEFVETGPTEEVFADPQHPYTEALVSSIPTPDPTERRRNITLTGTVPSPADPPSGCRFHTRCHRVIQPEALGLDRDAWLAALRFRHRIAREGIDVEELWRTAESEDPDAEDVATDELLRKEFDLPQRFETDDADATLTEAIELVVDGAHEEAAELLANVFRTPCEETHPSFTDHGDNHRSACLLHTTESGRKTAREQ